MFAVINQNHVLWGRDIYPTAEAAIKDLRTMGVNPEKMTVIPLEPWQRQVIDALAVSEALAVKLRAATPLPPADERLITRHLEATDSLAAALQKIADGANDPVKVAAEALELNRGAYAHAAKEA